MYTQCPECFTVFSMDADILGRGHGLVRCGHCNATFDSLRTLVAHLPPEPFERIPPHPTDAHPPAVTVPVYRPNPQQVTFEFDPDERAQHRARRSTSTPKFARTTGRRAGRAWPWVLGTTVLALSLGAQLAYAERTQLLENRLVRPWLDRACESLHCQLPPRHDTSQLTLVSRDIRPHPSVKGALIISATLRNDGDFAQSYPTVEITLSDLDENRIAMRRFHPREYVSDTRVLAPGLAPGTTASLVVEVQDPGRNAVAFEFKFL